MRSQKPRKKWEPILEQDYCQEEHGQTFFPKKKEKEEYSGRKAFLQQFFQDRPEGTIKRREAARGKTRKKK